MATTFEERKVDMVHTVPIEVMATVVEYFIGNDSKSLLSLHNCNSSWRAACLMAMKRSKYKLWVHVGTALEVKHIRCVLPHAALDCRALQDMKHVAGVKYLNVSQSSIGDDQFVHFRGVRILHMSYCRSVTSAAFKHLHGIRKLYMEGCYQIEDAAYHHLKGIHTLHMSGCYKVRDLALQCLAGIYSLDLANCTCISDKGIAYLAGIQFLDISNCHLVTDAGIECLRGIQSLTMFALKQ